ncbi:MAG: hydantoinase/oxoprolinase family protein, partial [Pseudomonadota bacterium]
ANTVVEELKQEARSFVLAGAGDSTIETRLTLFMRYTGQGWEIPVICDQTSFVEDDTKMLLAAFEDAYRTLFGRIIDGLAVEITNWALNVMTPVPPTALVAPPDRSYDAEAKRQRAIFDAAKRELLDAAEVPRAAMRPGASVEGPAVIVERETSTIITAAYRATMQCDGALLIERKEARQ